MRNDRAAQAYLADAEIILSEAEASPKSHLLGRVIKKELVRRKVLDRKEADQLAYDSDSLALDREPSFYGSPEGVPAIQLFDTEDGEDALGKARRVLETVRAAMARYLRKE